MATVRGTQEQKPLELEFTKDTVYERKNIRRIEEADTDEHHGFSGWEYEETQYTYREWYQVKDLENKMAIAELAEMVGGDD